MRSAPSLLAALILFGGSSAFAADGAALYKANCASCHGADGKATTPAAKAMKVPPLAGTALTAEQIVAKVKSSDRHKNVAAKLSDDDLRAIAATIATL